MKKYLSLIIPLVLCMCVAMAHAQDFTTPQYVGSPSSGECLTWDAGNSYWIPSSCSAGAGDIDAVGDCSSGSCFTGTDTADNLVFQGSTSDFNTTTLTSVDSTGTNTIELPDNSGVVILDVDGLNALANTTLADPNVDRIVFWDDSGGQFEFLAPQSELSISSNSLNWAAEMNDLDNTTLSDPNVDRIVFWDDSGGQFEFLAPATGLSIASNSLNVDTAPALAANGANCSAGEIPLGVDAAGAAEGCYEPAEADISDLDHTATAITDGLIVEADLNADNAPVDEDFLTYDSTGANFVWRSDAEVLDDLASAANDWDANGDVTIAEADISDLSHTTDTNANTVCSGSLTYMDGEGNCDAYTLSGNTTELGTTSGTLTSGDCVEFDASGNLIAAGSGCGSGSGDVTAVGDCASGGCFVEGGSGATLTFEGATADAFETFLTSEDTTSSDKTITLPDRTGTVIVLPAIDSESDMEGVMADVSDMFTNNDDPSSFLEGNNEEGASGTNVTTNSASDAAISTATCTTVTKEADQVTILHLFIRVSHSVDGDTCCARIYKNTGGGYAAFSKYTCVTAGVANTGGGVDTLTQVQIDDSSDVDPDYLVYWQETGAGTCYSTHTKLECLTLDI